MESGVVQTSARNSKSVYDSFVTRKPRALVASMTPSFTCQSALPVTFQLPRSLPLNSDFHPAPVCADAAVAARTSSVIEMVLRIMTGDHTRFWGILRRMKYTHIVLSIAAMALCASLAHAQAAPDFSKVEIKANKVTDKFYTLDGQGGTIGVLFGPDGVFMVDTQFAPLSDKIAAAIKRLTPQPIKFIVNTHVHGDHTGGDENFGRMGATIISREELRYRLAHPNPNANGTPATPTAEIGLPKMVYRDRLTLRMNGEEIDMIAIPRAHTDGDTMVYFPGLDVMMTGDFFRSIQYPNVDRANGAVIGRAGPNTKIIPGHGPTVGRDAVIAHRDMALQVRDRVGRLITQGKSEDEAVAAKVTADLDAKIQEAGMTGDRFVRQVYQELKANR